jgi:hypothetical protein
MKALCHNGPADIRFEDTSDPQLRDSRQALADCQAEAIVVPAAVIGLGPRRLLGRIPAK